MRYSGVIGRGVDRQTKRILHRYTRINQWSGGWRLCAAQIPIFLLCDGKRVRSGSLTTPCSFWISLWSACGRGYFGWVIELRMQFRGDKICAAIKLRFLISSFYSGNLFNISKYQILPLNFTENGIWSVFKTSILRVKSLALCILVLCAFDIRHEKGDVFPTGEHAF